jgi:hypothetical protein
MAREKQRTCEQNSDPGVYQRAAAPDNRPGRARRADDRRAEAQSGQAIGPPRPDATRGRDSAAADQFLKKTLL